MFHTKKKKKTRKNVDIQYCIIKRTQVPKVQSSSKYKIKLYLYVKAQILKDHKQKDFTKNNL